MAGAIVGIQIADLQQHVLSHSMSSIVEFAKIGIFDRLVLSNLRWRPGRQNLSVVQYRDAVCERKNDIHVMFDDDHGLAFGQAPDQRHCIMLSLIHISEPTRQAEISYAVFCLKKKK